MSGERSEEWFLKFKRSVDEFEFLKREPSRTGGFGNVWRACVKGRKRQVLAYKQMKETAMEPDGEKYFMREVMAQARVSHPALLPLYGFIRDPENSVIITKWQENGSLDVLLREQKELFAWERCYFAEVFFGVAHAMAYLHREHIIHRDLKPSNLFLNEDYLPLVGDFGLARPLDDATELTWNVGTDMFKAPELLRSAGEPEQLESRREYDGKVDVYAFGMMMYFLLSKDHLNVTYRIAEGKKETLSLNKNSDILRHLGFIVCGKRPEDRGEIPKCYMSLIKRCWSDEPADRPSFDEIVEILRSDEFSECLLGTSDSQREDAGRRRRDYLGVLDKWASEHK